MSLPRAVPLVAALVAAVPTGVGCAGSGGEAGAGGGAASNTTGTAARPAVRFGIPGGPGHLALMAPKRGLALRDRPGGRVIARLPAKTPWGSATILWAPERRGDWLGVVSTAGNNRLGWIDAMKVRPRMWRSAFSLHADLSDRMVELHKNGEVVRRIPVSVGSPATPTPTGRYALTDKLLPDNRHGTYGCCVLALSGHQPRLRPDWAGGDRIAIHGSPSQQVGAAASAGCLRARDRDLQHLIDRLPLGTPVVIEP